MEHADFVIQRMVLDGVWKKIVIFCAKTGMSIEGVTALALREFIEKDQMVEGLANENNE